MAHSILSYEKLSYQISSRNKEPRILVSDVSVSIKAGELLAIMGPSGAGKSTLLDLMTFRKVASSGSSIVELNGRSITARTMHKLSAFVEQEDALLGCLTVKESIEYSLRLHSPRISRKQVTQRVDTVISALGLRSCADQRIRTTFGRGISDGQKRRVSAACAMVTYPEILFLDEVTSGLDSTAAREVMSAIRKLALAEGMIVVATIHQPSMELMAHFDNLLMLARGKTCYLGSVNGLEEFLDRWGRPTPRYTTPFEHAMNFLNDDFDTLEENEKYGCPQEMHDYYISALPTTPTPVLDEVEARARSYKVDLPLPSVPQELFDSIRRVAILSKRTAINYSRNLQAYGVRIAMYAAMAIFISTIWVRQGQKDSTINDRLAVHFFVPAFLSTISIACIPGYLEERAVYYRETKNGSYTTLHFLLANTLVNLPLLFICSSSFSLIVYWALGLHPGASAFFRFLTGVFLAIIVGESQTILIASVVPSFMAAIAITACTAGFLLCLCGFFIKARSLPRFWYYTFHQVDWMKYCFELLAKSDLAGLTFECEGRLNGSCSCAYPAATLGACEVSGHDVLNYLEIGSVSIAKWAGVLVAIFVGFRILIYIALRVRSK